MSKVTSAQCLSRSLGSAAQFRCRHMTQLWANHKENTQTHSDFTIRFDDTVLVIVFKQKDQVDMDGEIHRAGSFSVYLRDMK